MKERLEALSQQSQSMRKDLKAPESYPKKNQLSSFGSKKTVHSLSEVSSIKCLDIDYHDKFIISATEDAKSKKSSLNLYDIETKAERKITNDSMVKDIKIVKFVPGTKNTIIANESKLQAWSFDDQSKIY